MKQQYICSGKCKWFGAPLGAGDGAGEVQDSKIKMGLGCYANARNLKFILNIIGNHCGILCIFSSYLEQVYVSKYLPKVFKSLKQLF